MGSNTFRAEARTVMDGLRRIVRELRVAAGASEGRLGLSAAQLFVLQKLEEGGAAVSVNELAERTFTHQSSVSVVLSRLSARRLVIHRAAAQDARRREIALSRAGRALLRHAPESVQSRLLRALDRLPRPAVRRLGAGLSLLAAAMHAGAPDLFFEDGAASAPRPARARRAPARARRG
jgi:DNA-binding MarR family transcriptional regulator